MGLADRDYMKERYRERQGLGTGATVWNDKKARPEIDRRSSASPVRAAGRAVPKWLLLVPVLATALSAYRIAKRDGWFPDREPALEFPESGSVTVARTVKPRTARSRLRVVTGGANAVVQLFEPASDRHIISVYVRKDDDVTVAVPPGSYRMRIIEGHKWHGRTRFFGASMTYETVARLMTFTRTHFNIVDLHRSPVGNLPTTVELGSPTPL